MEGFDFANCCQVVAGGWGDSCSYVVTWYLMASGLFAMLEM